MITDELKILYQQMSELTQPHCATLCRAPQSCCSPEYCEMAMENAANEGVVLTSTNHPNLPLMGEKGCVCPPHLRPNCTLHVCAINGMGVYVKDMRWTRQYFKLRNKIEKAELRNWQ